MTRPWVSVHIFYHDEPRHLLVDCLQPLVSDLKRRDQIRASFFVRYWQEGPHIRFRVLPNNGLIGPVEREVEARVSAFLKACPSLNTIDAAAYQGLSRAVSSFELGQSQTTCLQPNNTVQVREYVPDLDGFGGNEALPVIEQFFSYSSEVAFRLLRDHNFGERKIGAAFLSLLTGLRVFVDDVSELSAWADLYHARWVPILNPHSEALLHIFERRREQQADRLKTLMRRALFPFGPGDELLLNWQQQFTVLRGQLDRLQSGHGSCTSQQLDQKVLIALNCLHMHNNRLGLTLYDEAYLSYLIKATVQAW